MEKENQGNDELTKLDSDFTTGAYWRKRSDLIYYQYLRMIVRCIGAGANSLIDVGTGNVPYLEWFQWIESKISIDIGTPYSSNTVKAIQGDIFVERFPMKFDICTSFQVLEHVEDAEAFAHRLMELGDLVLVSVPYMWPEKASEWHVHDPVDLPKVTRWFGRAPNWHQVVQEPFLGRIGQRMFALYDVRDPSRKFGVRDFRGRVAL
jgi:hypothetical protein